MKHELDKFYNDNYCRLLELAKKMIWKYKRSYSPDVLVSDSYFYCVDRLPNMRNVNDIEGNAIHFIEFTTKMWNSALNQQTRKEKKETVEIDLVKYSLTESIESERNRDRLQQASNVLKGYLEKEKDKTKRRTLNLYLSGEPVRSIAEKEGVNYVKVHRLFNKLEAELRIVHQSVNKFY